MARFEYAIGLLILTHCAAINSFATAAEGIADLPPTEASGSTPQHLLSKAESLFNTGAFNESGDLIKPLLVDDYELTRTEKARLYLLKARLSVAFNHEEDLDIWIGKAFRADSSISLDPLKDPPEISARWNALKQKSAPADTAEPNRLPPKTNSTEVVGVDSRGKSFASGLLPFGIAQFHSGRIKDGALYLSASLAAAAAGVSLSNSPVDSGIHVAPGHAEALTALTLLGVYGFQTLDMSAELFDRDAGAAQKTYGILSFAPFGVGQLRNGEPVKALVFAGIELVAIGVIAGGETAQQRDAAIAGLSLALALGAGDAHYHYKSVTPEKPKNATGWTMKPLFVAAKSSQFAPNNLACKPFCSGLAFSFRF